MRWTVKTPELLLASLVITSSNFRSSPAFSLVLKPPPPLVPPCGSAVAGTKRNSETMNKQSVRRMGHLHESRMRGHLRIVVMTNHAGRQTKTENTQRRINSGCADHASLSSHGQSGRSMRV